MEEDKLLSLKCDSFSSQLALSMDTYYEKQQFVDISLVCKDETVVKCHKMILANSSTFFHRLLVANKHPHPMIILHDIEADVLKLVLTFMYCGEIKVTHGDVKRLLRITEILEVTDLRTILLSIEELNNVPNDAAGTPNVELPLKIVEISSIPRKDSSEQNIRSNSCEKPTSYLLRTVPVQEQENAKYPVPKIEILNKSPRSAVLTMKDRIHMLKSSISCKLDNVNRKCCGGTHKSIKTQQATPVLLERKNVVNPAPNKNISTTMQRDKLSAKNLQVVAPKPTIITKQQDTPTSLKRKHNVDSCNWNRILMLSPRGAGSEKRLCVIDKAPGTATSPTIVFTPTNNTTSKDNSLVYEKFLNPVDYDRAVNCTVIIKDELDINVNSDEDANMNYALSSTGDPR